MKINKLILSMLAPVMLGACSNWLEVAPDDQVNEKTLFAKVEGFKNALNGVYKCMAETDLYGRELCYGTVEILGHSYVSYDLLRQYNDLYNYKFTTDRSKGIIKNIWSKTYTAIANCNSLISNIEDADPIIFPDNVVEKNLIMGEAYALRAFLHFDMLRLFAPSQRANEDKSKTYIPYFDKNKSTFEPHLTVDQTLEKIIADLIKAKDLVAAFDTLQDRKKWLSTELRMVGITAGNTENANAGDLFYTFRGFRLNYYAIIATLARVYSWSGELQKAHDLAMEIIKAKYGSTPYFNFVPYETFNKDHRLYGELLFTLSRKKLIEEYELYLPGSDSEYSKFYADLTQIGWSRGEVEDARFKSMLTFNYQYYHLKYTKHTGNSNGNDMIPMIRLSEMYAIAAEHLYKNGNPTEAYKLMNALRLSRGIKSAPFERGITNEASFEKQLTSEIQKDLFGEGQAFYWYKKFNLKIGYGDVTYVIPTPDNENIF